MKKLHLHGHLANEFGKSFDVSANTVADVIRLMEANFPQRFYAALQLGWYVISTNHRTTGMSLDELQMQTGAEEIHIRPVAAGQFKGFLGLLGAGSGGLLGGVFAPFGVGGGVAGAGIGGLGVGGAAGGFGSIALGLGVLGILMLVSSAMAPNKDEKGDPAERPSFLFDGATNSSEQGVPVPLVYGRIRTGSVLIYGGLSSERLVRTGDNRTDADAEKFTAITKPALKSSFGAVII